MLGVVVLPITSGDTASVSYTHLAGKAIPTVRRFSERTAKAKKGGFIRINPQDAGVPKMHFLSLEMKALDALKAIDRLLNPSQQAVE